MHGPPDLKKIAVYVNHKPAKTAAKKIAAGLHATCFCFNSAFCAY